MDIDSGSLHSVISFDCFLKSCPFNPPQILPDSGQFLRTGIRKKLNVNRYFQADVSHYSCYAKLFVSVVDDKGKTPLGRS